MTRDINTWVYNGDGGMDDNYHKNNGLWTETTEKTFYDQLEVVPPIRMKFNAFMVGECYTHDYDLRQPIYSTFVQIGNRFFGKHCALNTFNPGDYTLEIKKQFNL